MIKKIIIALIVLPIIWLDTLHAQLSIETRLCYADTTRFQFTGEWQYLSTDIYLFNGNKFSRVINELGEKGSPRKRKKGLAEERLEYLYITAQLINVKFFGDANVVYPLYNFRINKDKNEKYETLVSDNIENIRIIDNLPLYSASDKIDAKINVNAITQNDRDNIMGVIGAQLRNLANLMRPSNAVLALIGEMGSFIESNSKKKEYKFSSTIRLFEQKNFDTRLHSIRIYAITSANSYPVRINDEKLKKYFDTCKMPDLSRGLLEKLIGYNTYPLIVVANYKSLYRMESISGDEVTFAGIDRRKVNIENNYRNKLISEETYKQERDFIDFLTVFANFKSQLELYTLNARMGNADAAMNALGTTTQQYCMLLDAFERINYKYRNNKTFTSVFKSEYASILDFATFYLENDHNLRAAKTMVATMGDLNSKGLPKLPTELEMALRNLRFIDNMNAEFKVKAKEGQSIAMWIDTLEKELLNRVFSADIAVVKLMPSVNERKDILQRLKERMGTTHCLSCREQATNAIKDYNVRVEALQRAEALESLDSLVQTTKLLRNTYSSKVSTMVATLGGIKLTDNSNALHKLQYQQINTMLLETSRDIENLNQYLAADVKDKSIDIIKSLGEKIQQTSTLIYSNLPPIQAQIDAFVESVAAANAASNEPVVEPSTIQPKQTEEGE